MSPAPRRTYTPPPYTSESLDSIVLSSTSELPSRNTPPPLWSLWLCATVLPSKRSASPAIHAPPPDQAEFPTNAVPVTLPEQVAPRPPPLPAEPASSRLSISARTESEHDRFPPVP